MSDSQNADSVAESRRQVLKKFGRYAAAATPTMLMLLDSNRQSAMAGRKDDKNDYEGSKPVGRKDDKKKEPKWPPRRKPRWFWW
jgi:hypothetical protein